MTATHALLVALGGAVGAPARLLVGHWLRTRWSAVPPAGTLAVNVGGSLLLGLLVGGGAGPGWLTLLGTGFCGAFTTFSTLALEVWEAVEDGRRAEAAAVVGLSLVLGLGAAALGYALAS
ncbi:fluoride efflux transporter FluC [Phycicoccus duodecadis]|uniref:Fluoride-specific ion channel FluC n=1 Tax=Phycicoccus duodecadis TaxID=173053 RepID=A0A2N3YJ03_9MICO|nr:CrcB family protein [Phycicoccus duodecadis]PKW26788.1 camphor resistance protein CrcB [Phycicoccus duodecadis]